MNLQKLGTKVGLDGFIHELYRDGGHTFIMFELDRLNDTLRESQWVHVRMLDEFNDES